MKLQPWSIVVALLVLFAMPVLGQETAKTSPAADGSQPAAESAPAPQEQQEAAAPVADGQEEAQPIVCQGTIDGVEIRSGVPLCDCVVGLDCSRPCISPEQRPVCASIVNCVSIDNKDGVCICV